MSDREGKIRQRAYHMWEAEGRPHGRAEADRATGNRRRAKG